MVSPKGFKTLMYSTPVHGWAEYFLQRDAIKFHNFKSIWLLFKVAILDLWFTC